MNDQYPTDDNPETQNPKEPGAPSGDEPNFAPSETAAGTDNPNAGPQPSDATAECIADVPPDAEADGEAAVASDEQAPVEEGEDPDARIAALEAEVAEMNDRALRALAEAENVRRRAQRDKEDATKYAIKSFAEDMLRVGDNLGRALSSIDSDARGQDANLENIAVGVEMVQKELLTAFERANVKPIQAMGARFDPMLHEAMFEIEDPSQPAGTVAQVLEDGFTLHGRTLRAAKVGVTKGGPKAEAKPQGADDDAASADTQQREGQHAYEQKSDGPTGAGGQLDEEL